jgi:hypothetical protein
LRTWSAFLAPDLPGLTSLRQGYGGPPKRLAKAEDPAYTQRAKWACRAGSPIGLTI